MKHRADSLTRLNKKDLNDAAEQNGMNKKMILFYFSILLHNTLRGLKIEFKNLSMIPLHAEKASISGSECTYFV